MPYGSILRRALEITWRHKILWVFGIILAVFGGASGFGGGGGGGQSGAQFSGDSSQWEGLGRALPFDWARGIQWEAIIPIIVGAGLLALLLGLIYLIVSVIARYTSFGALIAGVDEVERTGDTRFNSALRAGWARFVQLFIIDLLLGIAGFIVALPLIVAVIVGLGLVIGPAIAIGASGGEGAVVAGVLWGVLTFLIWLVVVIALATVVAAAFSILREYALRFSVLEGHGIFESIGDAFRLAIARLGPTLLIWLILAGIGLLVGLVLFPAALVGAGAAAALFALLYALFESWVVLAVLAIPVLLVLGALVTLGSGIYQTFQSAVWTLAFRELREQETPLVTGPTV